MLPPQLRACMGAKVYTLSMGRGCPSSTGGWPKASLARSLGDVCLKTDMGYQHDEELLFRVSLFVPCCCLLAACLPSCLACWGPALPRS